jgi:predicted phosphodiesterase
MSSLEITDAELTGVTEDSFTVCFSVEDQNGPVSAEARVLVDGQVRASSSTVQGPRLVRVAGLEPATDYRVAIEAEGASSAAPTDAFFPGRLTTLPAATGSPVATLATLGDLHIGEDLLAELPPEAGADALAGAYDPGQPYWRFMLEDAVRDIEDSKPDLVIAKGDLTDGGTVAQYREVRAAFDSISAPVAAFLGNHDFVGGEAVDDPYEALGQERVPRCIDLAGWRLVLLDTTLPGQHHGGFGPERQDWLARTLAESTAPTLLFMHHHPVPPEFSSGYIGRLGIRPQDSLALIDLVARNPQVKAVLVGHTHRNRVRRYAATSSVPFVEVCSLKDYPGAWAHYRLYADGSFRQELRRVSTARALVHARLCSGLFAGGYRGFALGKLADRCFATG